MRRRSSTAPDFGSSLSVFFFFGEVKIRDPRPPATRRILLTNSKYCGMFGRAVSKVLRAARDMVSALRNLRLIGAWGPTQSLRGRARANNGFSRGMQRGLTSSSGTVAGVHQILAQI